MTFEFHHPQHPDRQTLTRRSTLVSVVVNLVLSIVQIVVGVFSASQGLIADGFHSLSDLVADFVVLLAAHYSHRAADDDHQYGHQRFENGASLVLGGLMVGVGLSLLWSAANKLQQPAHATQVHVAALWVALGALVGKELLFRYMLRVGERLRSSVLIANAWHARSDAASSLVVAVGIGGNLLGYTLLDPVSALIVGLMISKTGWSFAWRALYDLMDGAASEADIARIRAELLATPGVLGLHDLRTRKMGDLIVVDVHLEIDGSLNVAQGHEIAEAAAARTRDHLPMVLSVMTHVDPVSQHPQASSA